MVAALGDRVFVASVRPGHERMGRVVALRHPDGSPPYVVRWDDSGTETLHFPRDDCRIEPALPVADVTAAVGPTQRVHHWTVTVDIVEHDEFTTAHAVLHEDDAPTVVTGRGESVRRAGDRSMPEVGAELAVSRALRQLSDRLAHAVRNTLIDVEHRDVDLVDLRPSHVVVVREPLRG
jgi:hypothetical protein